MAAEKDLGLLQKLIQIPSYSGQEGPIQKFIQGHFQESGIETVFQGENLVVHIRGKDPTRAFIFNSHTDVVDVGDETRWTHGGPWSGEIEDGRIYGRGASDMKGGVFASIEAAKLIHAEGVPPTDVWFTYVVKEEVDGSGTDDFAKWFVSEGHDKQYKEVAAVFTEPTNLDTVEHGSRGNYFLKAAIDGDAGHSSRPDEIEVHTINRMVGFINDLDRESAMWSEKFKNDEFAPPTITPTAMEAKSQSANKTADHCEAVFDLRTAPGFHSEAFDRVVEIAKEHGITISFLYPDTHAGYTKKDAKIVTALQQIVPELKLKICDASTDLGFLTRIGVEGIIFGPGQMELAHKIDESMDITQLDKAIELFVKLYKQWAVS